MGCAEYSGDRAHLREDVITYDHRFCYQYLYCRSWLEALVGWAPAVLGGVPEIRARTERGVKQHSGCT